MVPTVYSLHSKHKVFKLRQRLTCLNYGVYVATCVTCGEQYVGQTANKFSTRWNAHRSAWKKYDISDNTDQAALLRHAALHFDINDKPQIFDCYSVYFVEQPNHDTLDICEDKWLHRTRASINIQDIMLPKIK